MNLCKGSDVQIELSKGTSPSKANNGAFPTNHVCGSNCSNVRDDSGEWYLTLKFDSEVQLSTIVFLGDSAQNDV